MGYVRNFLGPYFSQNGTLFDIIFIGDFMRKELVETLSKMTEEEERIIRENGAISKELYTSEDEFVIDAAKLLEKDKLIA